MSVLVWAMLGIAVWHFAVLVPDRFTGGIIGAFLAAVAGALVAGPRLGPRARAALCARGPARAQGGRRVELTGHRETRRQSAAPFRQRLVTSARRCGSPPPE